MLFAAKVPARKFSTTSIDQFQTIEQEESPTYIEKSSVSDKEDAGESDIPVVALPK